MSDPRRRRRLTHFSAHKISIIPLPDFRHQQQQQQRYNTIQCARMNFDRIETEVSAELDLF